MLLNDVVKEVGMTKRAVKYYEEKGLLTVKKDANGYRNYSDQDVEVLRKISLYRKLGIGLKDIQSILNDEGEQILKKVYQEKLLAHQLEEKEIQALQRLLVYCDETTIKIPFLLGLGAKLAGGIAKETRTSEELISYYRNMDEEQYEKLKQAAWKGAKLKSGIMKYHPSFAAQRKLQKELQNKGYNDIFIPNLKILSPQYAEYKDAMDQVNERICRELGLYYDANYNLRIKKDK